MKITEYIDYVNSNADSIARYVDECFERSRDFLRIKLIRMIKSYIEIIPIHYEWEYDDDPYDHSGILIENGFVSMDQSVSEFLDNEYTGQKSATYENGMGWSYDTYGDELSYYTLELGYDIMLSAISRSIEEKFSVTITTDELEDIRDNCNNFDDIYDSCLASDFFCYEPAVGFTGIGGMKLRNIIKRSGAYG
ncbi:MAG: hypothetical protein K6G03_01860 [Lachnospiraceae bacterium]|nr:hypothetical protein [Lachnospiraceae bacterium]